MNKNDLIQAFTTSVKELQQGIDQHCCLAASLMAVEVDDRNLKPIFDLCPSKNREHALKTAVIDAINTLEESRKAFKSKQLELLRKRLTQVLIDLE
ncbi:MAG: hypothetical protein ACOC23_06920 [Thermodesulfobacteriota bacterium]